jgi:hypothetical protein
MSRVVGCLLEAREGAIASRKLWRSGVLVAAILSLAGLVFPIAAQASFSWSPAAPVDQSSGSPLAGVACPSGTECVAVDSEGREVTFNPASPGSPAATLLERGDAVNAVACPSSTECVAVDGGGREMAFNPLSPATPTPVSVDPGQPLSAVACPITTQCSAAGPNGQVVTFDPTSGAVPGPPTSIDGGRNLTGIACTDSTQCTVVDDTGGAVAFLIAGFASQRTVIDSGHKLLGIACLPTQACAAVDDVGQEVSFTAGSPPAPPGAGSAFSVDAGHQLHAVACSSGSQCTAVDEAGREVTFNPPSPGTPTPTAVAGGRLLRAVSCPSATRCTAVTADGREVAFDPTNPGSPTAAAIDSTPVLTAVNCPSSGQCTAVDGEGREVTFSPGASGPAPATALDTVSLTALDCPSGGQCTAVDINGSEVTFDPTSPAGSSLTAIETGTSLHAVACAGAFQCTAVDSAGNEVTFNPQAAPGSAFPNPIDPGRSLTGVACPTAQQCVAVDDAGQEITFAPGVPFGGGEAAVTIDGTNQLEAVTCPSTSQCTAVDALGQQITFDPGAPSGHTTSSVTAAFLNAVTCTSASHCFAADRNGRALEGDPTSAAAWAPEPISGARSVDAVACATAILCVAVDSNGQRATGVFPIPVNTVAPTISGEAAQGKTLTESHGVWLNTPTSFSLQWEDCDAAGNACTPIPGANSQTYTLGPADVGHTVVVIEAASNPGGSGNPATSAPTATVQAPARPAVFLTNMQFTATSATFSGLVVPNGLATTAHFEYDLDPQYFGANPPPFISTGDIQVGSDFASHPVSVTVSGLVPNAIYHVRLVASNPDGAARTTDQTFTTKQLPPPPDPVITRSVNVAPSGGHVLIKPPRGKSLHLVGRATKIKTGAGFVPLTQTRQIPAGSQIDARRGTLTLVSATGVHHKLQKATFSGAIFSVSQTGSGPERGLTTMALVDGAFPGAPSFASCRAGGARAKAALSSRTLQLLHGKDRGGRFGSRGRYAAATARGTSWTIADRCDGTLTRVQRGIVSVLDFATHKTTLLHAGQSHLVKAPAPKRK